MTDRIEKEASSSPASEPELAGGFVPLEIIEGSKKRKKKTKEYYDQMLYPKVEASRENPPRATRHLNRQTMCGACNFKCCVSEIFVVEASPAEAEKLGTPLAWPQNGRCQYLCDSGCGFGSDRPSFCKLYPIEIDFERNQLIAPFWAITHCPTPKDFVFVGMDGEKYVYRKREDIKGPKKNNIQDEIRLDYPIEEFPNILENNAQALRELYGDEMLESVRSQLKELNGEEAKTESGGFDFEA